MSPRPPVNPFRPFLDRQGFVVLDGGLATALEERGHRLDTALWSARLLIDAPDEIAAVHRAYLDAGADCITTASYQASYEGFRARGLSDQEADELLLRSVALAVGQRDRHAPAGRSAGGGPAAADVSVAATGGRPERAARPLVAASIGPYGAFLADGSEYRGDYGVGPDVLDRFHRRRFELLASSDADVLACETLPSAEEAEVLLAILDDTPSVWAWMSFTCRDGSSLRDRTPFVEAVRLCSDHERVAAVGVNCTHPRHVRPLVERAAAVTELPLIAYPNSGEAYDARSKRWTGDWNAEAWLQAAEGWRAAGASIVGGCCRVGPDLIARLRAG